jgi:hypothetical protein
MILNRIINSLPSPTGDCGLHAHEKDSKLYISWGNLAKWDDHPCKISHDEV